jgi:hypothetical protein
MWFDLGLSRLVSVRIYVGQVDTKDLYLSCLDGQTIFKLIQSKLIYIVVMMRMITTTITGHRKNTIDHSFSVFDAVCSYITICQVALK